MTVAPKPAMGLRLSDGASSSVPSRETTNSDGGLVFNKKICNMLF